MQAQANVTNYTDGDTDTEATMDEYDKKFAEMQKYIPFLEAMIERLQKVKDKSREAQLQKMQSLHGILSNSKRKLRIEILQRCEDVLQKLHNKVEKGNATGLNTSHKESEGNSLESTSSNVTSVTNTATATNHRAEKMDNETPASPSPPGSPEHVPRSNPIIIPTERKDDSNSLKSDSKPASPDQCEIVPVVAPIIIPTERMDQIECHVATKVGVSDPMPDNNDTFEWDMLEESEKQFKNSRKTSWASGIASGSDVITAAKLVSNNLPQKVNTESNSPVQMSSRHGPSASPPSLRKLISSLEKTRLIGANATPLKLDKRPDSPTNVPDIRLKSPDPEILFPKPRITSPRPKENIAACKLSPKPATPLLSSPPLVLTEPPLSIEDLAELLSDESDNTKKNSQRSVDSVIPEQLKTSHEVKDDANRSKRKEIPTGKVPLTNTANAESNDQKHPNTFVLTQEDIDRESERQWEERDKAIVKLTTLKYFPMRQSVSPSGTRHDSSTRSTDVPMTPSPPKISQPLLSPDLLTTDKPVDHRNHPPSPLQNFRKEKENDREPRYADNYERHPRLVRDQHDSGGDTQDRANASNLLRITDEYATFHTNVDGPSQSEDCSRNTPLYHRRGQTGMPAHNPNNVTLTRAEDCRRDNPDFFARSTPSKPKRTPLLPSPNVPDAPNLHWGPPVSGYSGNVFQPQAPPQPNYQHPPNQQHFHQDVWPMSLGPTTIQSEFLQTNDNNSRNPQFVPVQNVGPMRSPVPRPDFNRGLSCDTGFREETSGGIQPVPSLISPTGFPVGVSYRNTRVENRPYEQPYERPPEFTSGRPQWDTSPTDIGYRRDNEPVRSRVVADMPNCGPGTTSSYNRPSTPGPGAPSSYNRPSTPGPGTPSSYNRPSTPGPLWSRERPERTESDWVKRGRGRDRYFNERSRSESRSKFNRDSRRSDWERDGHGDRDNRTRFNRDARVCERDPRVRSENRAPSPPQSKETVATSTIRDPRLNKDPVTATPKAQDIVGSSSDRDPRRRSSESKSSGKSSSSSSHHRGKDKSKSHRQTDSRSRKDLDTESKEGTNDKTSKDKLQSPLEYLYGVIDTKAKTGQGYGLQKFKIPKIKRSDPPPTASVKKSGEVASETADNSQPSSDIFLHDAKVENNDKAEKQPRGEVQVDAITNSNLSSDDKVPDSASSATSIDVTDDKSVPAAVPGESNVQDDKPERNDTRAASPVTETVKPTVEEEQPKESETSKPKEEVTKEWIEALIKQSIEFGQGKQLFDQAKLLQQLGEALHAKKFKKIKKIIESDSESSSSSKEEEIIQIKKLTVKKKRRIIVSDSSEEESLADRLGLIKDSENDSKLFGKKEKIINEPSDKSSSRDQDIVDANTKIEESKKGKEKVEDANVQTIDLEDTKVEETKAEERKIEDVDCKTDIEDVEETTEREKDDNRVVTKNDASPSYRRKRSRKKKENASKKTDLKSDEHTESCAADKADAHLGDTKSNVNESVEKDSVPKSKPKAKRRNSLEMLQEDIREMFISEGVVTATGHRMCRLLKEGTANLDASTENISQSMDDTYAKRSRRLTEKQSMVVDSDNEDDSEIKQNDTNSSLAVKSKGRSKPGPKRFSKRASKVSSREYLQFSDSEDNKPPGTEHESKITHVGSDLDAEKSKTKSRSGAKRSSRRALRILSREYLESSDSDDHHPSTSLPQSMSPKTIDDPSTSGNKLPDDGLPIASDSPLSPEAEKSEESPEVSLRRSRRVPRVLIEKTDITKIDSSKIMFDSSSDESFGIDVSELAAAVDISLHPEPEMTEALDSAKRTSGTKKSTKRVRSSKKDDTMKLEDKTDDALSFTDEGSVLSDISRSSSTVSKRKTNKRAASRNSNNVQQDTNEQLLSDLLIGIDSKSRLNQSNDVDKDSDAAADEELEDIIIGASVAIKKGTAKKKKKRHAWQMGIVSKKKRKKKSTTLISPSIEASEMDVADSTVDCDKSVSLDNLSNRTDVSFAIEGEIHPEDSSGSSVIKSDSSKNIQDDSTESNPDKVIDDIESTRSRESQSESKSKVTRAKTPSNERIAGNTNAKRDDIETSYINPTDSFDDYDASEMENLIQYAWSGQERYRCMVCTFTGKNIVHHYKLNHPESEVLISRLPPDDVKRAMEETVTTKVDHEGTSKYNCRFCSFATQRSDKCAKVEFYEHCTTHTGEYRFKCASCPYQTVVKASLRSHYYKVCRKFSETVSAAIIEDKIPTEDGVFGYVCSVCHFLQLKKSSIDEHLSLRHGKNPHAKSIKINMSVSAKGDTISTDDGGDKNKDVTVIEEEPYHSDESIEIIEASENANSEPVTPKKKLMRRRKRSLKREQTTEFANIEEDVIKAENQSEELETSKSFDEKTAVTVKPTKKRDSSPQESEQLSVNGNLSAFVCPPHIENKDREIQLERKKKMEEIVQNIGIKVNREGSKRSLSIIDKLKDKMETSSRIDEPDNNEIVDSGETFIETSKISTSGRNDTSLELGINNVTERSSTFGISIDANLPDQILSCSDTDVNLASNFPEDGEGFTDVPDKSLNNSESKLRDPLATVDELRKNDGSETEISDIDIMSASTVVYESDSSTTQSEFDVAQDVDLLLGQTGDNDPGKRLMNITIQRLAAQLQSKKNTSPNKSTDVVPVEKEESTPTVIPKAPAAVPISSIRRLLRAEMNHIVDVKNEPGDDTCGPRNILRLRRLSGDKLSIPTQSSAEGQEDSQLSSAEGSNTDLSVEVLQTDTEEECSFLKIANVVSLAPSADDVEVENSIISDIRKAVETSPLKSRVSVLKKNSPIILQKIPKPPFLNNRSPGSLTLGDGRKIIPVASIASTSQKKQQEVLANFIPIQSKANLKKSTEQKIPAFVGPLIVAGKPRNITTIPPKTTGNRTAVKPNVKIIKFTRAPTVLKHKENAAQSFAMKLKSAESYALMLTPPKLCHLYKCMARNCSYTTNSTQHFKQHYNQHEAAAKKLKLKPPYGSQNCAYCCAVSNDWSQLEEHMSSRHAHCKYQCHYCFYRAVTQSYVELHQAISHPGSPIAVLEATVTKTKIPNDRIDRHEIIKPFVCQQECGKTFYIPEAFLTHLKTKHASMLTIYKCHMCHATSLKPEKLIAHYKMHTIYKYQCMYCLNGSDMLWELHNHLSNFHCSLLPYIIERSLSPQATVNADVIDQLIMKNVEDGFKYTELIRNIPETPEEEWRLKEDLEESSSSSTTTLTKHINYEELLAIDEHNEKAYSPEKDVVILPIMTSDSEVDPLDIPKSNLQIDSPFAPTVLENDSGTNSGMESLLAVDVDSMHKNKNIAPTANQAVVPNRIFVVNNTIIDVSNIPKSVESASSFAQYSALEQSDPLADTGQIERSNSLSDAADPDSDIEILEENTQLMKMINSPTISEPEKVTSSVKLLQSQKSEIDDLKKSPISSENADDTSQKDDPDMDAGKKIPIKQPLTLEDISYTGFTGSHLYKCGNDKCDFRAETADLLRNHLFTCDTNGKCLNCAHCNKRFIKLGFLLEHLKVHGLKRFGCSLCNTRCAMAYQIMSHMKYRHKQTQHKLVPADPRNPSRDGLFVVQPIHGSAEKGKRKKRSPTKDADKDVQKSAETEKISFNPEEIDSLPRQAIYNREVLCAVCPYSTKVRTNMIRHLQLHGKEETVPESGPVNPVPCLDKKERMFDKMVNLASSSHQNGRMGGKPRESNKDTTEDASLPKYVPEQRRYVCGVAECNYLTVDDTMLRCHLKALHSDEPYFRCPHCPPPLPGQETQNITMDKMGIHLKMHDSRLYKCSHCNHHHYHRHVVERHLADKHPESRPFVKVIREAETSETANVVPEETNEGGPDPDGNNWRCNMCDYKCVYKAEMITHVWDEHEERAQFKCTECPYKTTGKIVFQQHFTAKHPHLTEIKYEMVYQKIQAGPKKTAEATEQTTSDEPFDTTPLWRRDMPRVRHIRGILLEEENETTPASEGVTKSNKRKSDSAELSTKPSKAKSSKLASSDPSMTNEDKSRATLKTPDAKKKADTTNSTSTERQSKVRAVDKLRSLDKSELDSVNESPKGIKTTETDLIEDFNELSDSDMGQFGPYGKPNGNMYVCTLCNYFQTKYKHDMRDHLYRELKYKKWHCRGCGFLSVNRRALLKHFETQHLGEQPVHEVLTPDNTIEEWVNTLLQRQLNTMRGISNKATTSPNKANTSPNKANTSPNKASTTPNKEKTVRNTAPAPTEVHSSPNSSTVGSSVKQSPTKSNTDSSTTVDLTSSIGTFRTTATDTDADVDIEGDDSIDNSDLVIDLKDDTLNDNESTKESLTPDTAEGKKDAEKHITCKHCNMKFVRPRGFKLHVQVTHLKRLGFLCPYCDRSTNSETAIRTHIRAKHPNQAERIVHNLAAGGPELTDEFWEKEYGLVPPKKNPAKKRKYVSLTDDANTSVENEQKRLPRDTCHVCGFVALNCAGLKAHLRSHANKGTVKCGHCTYIGASNIDVKQHSEINHPLLPFKFTDLVLPGSSKQTSTPEQQKVPSIDEYNDDIEEEDVPAPVDVSKTIVYCCYYCNLRSNVLETVKTHWAMMHRDAKNVSDPLKWKGGQPFRYKETHVPLPAPPKLVKCGYCKINAPQTSIKIHIRRKHGDVPIQFHEVVDASEGGWICHWCNELCKTNLKKENHHTMYHSHLPVQFTRQKSGEQPKGYSCPKCSFTTMYVSTMKKHVAKHVNLFKCKHCDAKFNTAGLVAAHNTQAHPELELKIESISNYDDLVEQLMATVLWRNIDRPIQSEITTDKSPIKQQLKQHAVAKKSTAKSTLHHLVSAPKIRCVARKSTNPLPRYSPGSKFGRHENMGDAIHHFQDKISYYGSPIAPINLAGLNTYMSVGGHQMKVNCTTLARLMDINPRVYVKDLKQDFKNVSALTNPM